MEKINLTYIKNKKSNPNISDFDYESAKTVNNFHESFDIYEITLLVDLKNLAKEIGLKGFFVKDESYRFGLNAFKVLGASYAIANIIREKIGLYEYKFTFDDIFTKIGMRLLANNISDDKKIISGESGAVTSGIVYSLMTDESLKDHREKIGLDKDSVILFFHRRRHW